MTGLMERFHLITLKETSPEKPKPTAEQNETSPYSELMQTCLANDFLKRFEIDDRVVVSHIFHHWAKKQAFYFSKRLLDKEEGRVQCTRFRSPNRETTGFHSSGLKEVKEKRPPQSTVKCRMSSFTCRDAMVWCR